MSHIKKIELITINDKPATTSREVAKHFNKRHDNVLQSINNLDCSPQFTELNFQVSEYKDRSGKACKEYIIFRDGFIFLTMGFTGKLAGRYKEAYIYSFNQMEKELKAQRKTMIQKDSLTLDDLLSMGSGLENTLLHVSHTKQGEIIAIDTFKQAPNSVVTKKEPTILKKPSWFLIVETFFAEIENGGIPEKMRQNILLSKEEISDNERHDCLFFRLSNLMTFLRKTPRFSDLMQKSTIQTVSKLLKQLKNSGVLAFNGKEKEKGIPIDPKLPLKTRRVSHLIAIDLVVLEQNYGIVMPNNKEIARAFY